MTLSDQEISHIKDLAQAVSDELKTRDVYSFNNKPTVYLSIKNEDLYIILSDEGHDEIRIEITSERKRGVIGFFIAKWVLEDFFSLDAGYISSFSEDKVEDYIQDTLEMNAYSKNLQRVENLVNDGHYYAALVILISAFEVASRDIFFRNNEMWFFTADGRSMDLYDQFGHKLRPDEKGDEYRTKVHLGDAVYGFTDTNYSLLKNWESVGRGNYVLNVCRQLGIREEYLQNLYGNSYKEINFYEILKRVLLNSSRRPINFQILDGTGGMKWSYKRFFSIDLEALGNDIRVIRENLTKRHQIIHGHLEDDQVTKNDVLELQSAIKRIIDYLRDQIKIWEYIL